MERREEVIKINLGRRSPEKSGGEVEVRLEEQQRDRQAVHQVARASSFRFEGGGGLQLQILSPGVTEAVWQWLRREAGGSERVGHIDSQGETFF